jgi:hypothetical protein
MKTKKSMKNLTECIHGMYWKTCNTCNGMEEKLVIEEVAKLRELRKTTAAYVTLESSNSNDDTATECDYDFEDLNVS